MPSPKSPRLHIEPANVGPDFVALQAAKPVGPALPSRNEQLGKAIADGYKDLAAKNAEPAWHKFALQLAVRANMSARDIAAVLGCPGEMVQKLFASNEFKEKYENEVGKKSGGSLFDRLLDGEDVNSLLTIIVLRDDIRTPPAIRYKCAQDLLDRVKGKPVQTVKSEQSVVKTTSDVESLEAELKELDSKQEEIFGATRRPQKLMPGEGRAESTLLSSDIPVEKTIHSAQVTTVAASSREAAESADNGRMS